MLTRPHTQLSFAFVENHEVTVPLDRADSSGQRPWLESYLRCRPILHASSSSERSFFDWGDCHGGGLTPGKPAAESAARREFADREDALYFAKPKRSQSLDFAALTDLLDH
jgi:hypothetical protein